MSYSECQTQPHSNVSLFFLPSHLDGFMGVRRKGEVICDLEKLDGWRWQKVPVKVSVEIKVYGGG